VLLSSDVAPNATHGWSEYMSIYQPAFEKELDRLAKAEPSSEIYRGVIVDEYGCDSIVKRPGITSSARAARPARFRR